MAEGYVYSSATDMNDLLNQIVSQAAVHGWNQRMLTGLGGNGRRGHISREGVTVNLASYVSPLNGGQSANAMKAAIIPSEDMFQNLNSYSWGSSNWTPDLLCINASTGFDDNVRWYRQPGADVQSQSALNQGRFSGIRGKGGVGRVHMFFFDNPAAFIVYAEVRAGEWYWLMAGNLQKDYEFAGGQFYGASMDDVDFAFTSPWDISLINIRVDSPLALTQRGNGWGDNFTTSPIRSGVQISGVGYTNRIGDRVPTQLFYNQGFPPSTWGEVLWQAYDGPTGRLWIHPPRAYVNRPNSTKSYLGVVPSVFHCTMESFIAGDIVTIGGQEYMLFPVNWRASPWSRTLMTENSGRDIWYVNNALGSGLAIRKPI